MPARPVEGNWFFRTTAAIVISLSLVCGLFAVGPQAVRQRDYPAGHAPDESKVNAKGFTSSRVCGECHVDIYNSWKNSLHAFSLTDPVFDTAFMQAIRDDGDKARQLCLRCHAPMTMFNEDYDLNLGVTREGVSCDFCHTVTAVHLDRPEQPYSASPGLTKRSILRKAKSPAHEVEYSALHGTSEFCGGCHNYATSSGSLLMGTYSEWKEGPYAAEGKQCQDCHMTPSEGAVATQTSGSRGSQIHVHSLIHDSEQLKSAVSVDIKEAVRRGQTLTVDVEVTNIGSGHMVPTGMPTRELLLEVAAESQGYTRTQEKRYRKVVANHKGQVLNTDYEVMLHGEKILNDNRLAPRESRTERFMIPVRETGPVTVKATVTYSYSPAVLGIKKMNIQLKQVQKSIR